MEYTSPGRFYSRNWLTVTSFLFLLLSVRVYGRQHQRNPDLNDFMSESDTFNSRPTYYDDYEESTVVHLPEFVGTSTNVTSFKGSLATLPCAVRYLGTRQVAWRRIVPKDKHFLTVGKFTWVRESNIKVDHKSEGHVSHWDLVIKSVQASNQGVYECQVSDSLKPIKTIVHLVVKDPPVKKPRVRLSGNEFVNRNEDIMLICNATGGPHIPEEIDWFKDGIKINERSPKFRHVVITKYRAQKDNALISQLIIEKSSEKDSGSYVCRSSDTEIDKLEVTVLVADTTNVKRGTVSKEHTGDQRDGGEAEASGIIPVFSGTVLLLSVLITVLSSCCQLS